MAEQLVESLGLVGLFIAAFAAASLLPFPVEAAVPAVVALGHSTFWIVVVGTMGGYLGSLLNYQIAATGYDRWAEGRPPPSERVIRWSQRLRGRASPVLIFSWLPVAGEALTVAAGIARVPLAPFSFWTIVGRALRMYGLVKVSLWLF